MRAVTVTHSPRGYRLSRPLTLTLPEPQNIADVRLQQHIINSLSWMMSSLDAFTFGNTSTLELAKHLLRHRTGSPATLYQYVCGVHRFDRSIHNPTRKMIRIDMKEVI